MEGGKPFAGIVESVVPLIVEGKNGKKVENESEGERNSMCHTHTFCNVSVTDHTLV